MFYLNINPADGLLNINCHKRNSYFTALSTHAELEAQPKPIQCPETYPPFYYDLDNCNHNHTVLIIKIVIIIVNVKYFCNSRP